MLKLSQYLPSMGKHFYVWVLTLLWPILTEELSPLNIFFWQYSVQRVCEKTCISVLACRFFLLHGLYYTIHDNLCHLFQAEKSDWHFCLWNRHRIQTPVTGTSCMHDRSNSDYWHRTHLAWSDQSERKLRKSGCIEPGGGSRGVQKWRGLRLLVSCWGHFPQSEGVSVGWVTINILYQGGCVEGPNLRHFNPCSSVQKPYRVS